MQSSRLSTTQRHTPPPPSPSLPQSQSTTHTEKSAPRPRQCRKGRLVNVTSTKGSEPLSAHLLSRAPFRTYCLRPPRPAAPGPLPPTGRPTEPPLPETGHPPTAEGRRRSDGLHHGHAYPAEGFKGGGAAGVAGVPYAQRGVQVRLRGCTLRVQ